MTANSGLNFPGIYTITNTISGKIYIGQTINIRRRWHSHHWHLRKNAHRNSHLQRAWNKYGEKAFVFKVAVDLSLVPKDQLQVALNAAEIKLLAVIPNSYNLTEAAKSGTTPSKETKEKLSIIRKKLWQDPEFRERRRISHQAACADPELQKRRSISLKKAMESTEYKEKKSTAFKKMWKNEEHRQTQSTKRKANWQDENYRKQQSESRKAAWVKRKAKQLESQEKCLPDKALSD